jgi:hypothetical protein
MAVGYKANAKGKIVLVMHVVGSRNIALNLDLARAGVKTGPYVRRAARFARGCRVAFGSRKILQARNPSAVATKDGMKLVAA